MRDRRWIGAAALLGAASVAFGAFGAHGLETTADGGRAAAAWVETGSRFQMAHALAILAGVAVGCGRLPLALWTLGGCLFPFSLYALALGAPTAVAALAPIGGAALLAGWAALAWEAVRARP